MKKRPRQSDVARLAGVSPTTVSLVINDRIGGNVRISEETRQRVREAVAELGYVIDPAARSLAGGQNCLLGVFTFEALFPLKHRDFYYPFLVGIEEEAEKQGYDLLLFTSTSDAAGKRRLYKAGVNRLRLADGAILLGNEESKDEISHLLAEGYPFVFVGRREAPEGQLSYVAADYIAATAEVVTYMIAAGHRQIAYLAGRSDAESHQDRRRGYRLAHEQAGLTFNPDLLQCCTAEMIKPAFIQSLLAGQITAFIVEHDALVSTLMETTQTLGKAPPHDFSLALLGDPLTTYQIPDDITTFTIPRREMGRQAVRLLAKLLAQPNDSQTLQITLPCTFVPGNTVAGPP